MAKDYIEYLSASVLNDGQTVSYRTLSRALKVHSNLAKQMLFDFHHIQNSKKAGTLHATYLITATQKIQPQSQSQENGTQDQDVQDTAMRSSPLPSSSAPVTQDPQSDSQEYVATLVTLVDQDHLEDAKAQFDELLSIHVYSVQPGKINDLQVLCECNRAIATTYATEDPLEASKQYGTIQNSNVKRRAFRKPQQQQQQQPPAQKSAPPPTTKAAASATKAASTFVSNMAAEKNTSKPTTSVKPAETAPAPAPAAASSKSTTAKAAPALVKRESSSLFKAFAKAKPKAQSQNTESSAEPSPAPGPEAKEDEPMQDLSDEEANDEDAAMFDEGALKDPTGKSKKEREDDLRRMMDMEDEPMTDAPPETPTEPEPEPEPTPSTSQTATENPPPAEPTETVTVTNGRRRGKRRVMKKKTVKDEEGYLVTREEAAWESFSEDEPVAKKPKVSVAPPAAVAKGKKGGAQKGQGSIMSFFSKK